MDTDLIAGLHLVRLLAVGDLGAVYAAQSQARGKVAVKVFHPELASDLSPELLRGLRSASDVGHPAVVAPLEIISDGDTRACVSGLVSGESAAQLSRRRRGRIPPSEALRVGRDVLDIIGTAHASSLCHGALSLSHVLLDEQGGVRLLGFGEARVRAHLGLGSGLAYLAPGTKLNAPSVEGDLWAVGAIVFVLLTGASPLSVAESSEAGGQRVRSLAELSNRAPRPLVELVDRMLSTEPARRWIDAGTELAAMREVLAMRDVQYAHALASTLAGQSGTHAWIDPMRVSQPPPASPSGSTPPVTPRGGTPPRLPRPISEPPDTPRSKHAPSVRPPPREETYDSTTGGSPAPPARASSSRPPPIDPAKSSPARADDRGSVRPPKTLTPERGASAPQKTQLPETAAGERVRSPEKPQPASTTTNPQQGAQQIRSILEFDSSMQLEDAWKAARKSPGGARRGSEDDASDAIRKLPSGAGAATELALELSSLTSPDPERLVQVAACSLEGPALGPALEAFGPALSDHVTRSLEHEPLTSLDLLLKLQRAVRAPPALLVRERQRVLDQIASTDLIQSLFIRLGGQLSDARALDSLGELLPSLGVQFAVPLANALPLVVDPSLRAKVVHHLTVELTDHEPLLAELGRTAAPRFGVEVVRLLAQIETLAARQALAQIAESPHFVVKLEALGASEGASSEKLRVELRQRLVEAPSSERIQTLRALADFDVRFAAPFLAVRIKSDELDSLPFEERRALLHALCVVAPTRAEAVLAELLAQKKLLSSSAHEETRALSASALGEVASSELGIETLVHHAGKHFGTSDRVRLAAERALQTVRARMAAGAPAHRSVKPGAGRSEAPPRPSQPPRLSQPPPKKTPSGSDRGRR
ncbi:MAG: protein kinase [Myxococcales bacterium]|nr:protein kinase [Myxococcales bacterium]